MPTRSLPVSISSHDTSFRSTFWSDSDDLDSSTSSISSFTVESRSIFSRLTLKNTTSQSSFYSARDDDTADTASVLSDGSPTFHLTLTATLSWLQHQFAKPSEKQQHEEATEEDPPETVSVFSISLWNCEPPMPTVASTFSYSEAFSDEDDDVELKYEETILQTAYPLMRS